MMIKCNRLSTKWRNLVNLIYREEIGRLIDLKANAAGQKETVLQIR